ncbi:MAG: hypothetical protein KDH15_06565 [Rhodocyclaceae bacterium]|nr:hypothetical protein [Rhodocyclaceae bacterium]
MIELRTRLDLLVDDGEVGDSLLAAVRHAMAMADTTLLPLTVYHAPDASEGCWAVTNTVSPRLYKARLFVTVLPSRYFSGYWAY